MSTVLINLSIGHEVLQCFESRGRHVVAACERLEEKIKGLHEAMRIDNHSPDITASGLFSSNQEAPLISAYYPTTFYQFAKVR